MPNSSAATVLDREFLQVRCDLLNLAAALDRIHRDPGFQSDDERWSSIVTAIETLRSDADNRAEQIQRIFSLAYRDDWREAFELRST